MSRMGEFVAFQAMMSLADDELVDRVYEKCKTQEELPREAIRNYVQELYDRFSYEDISRQIARIITPSDLGAEVRSEEHTSELQSLMRISYAVFCLKKKKYKETNHTPN